jgi:hypothetical protein
VKTSLDRGTKKPTGSARRGPASSAAAPAPTLRALLPTTAETVCDVVALRRAAGGPASDLSREEREQLIADARAGKLVRVVLDAVTYVQRDTPNRNFVRFKPGVLRSLAPSFAGQPVLRNHDQHDTVSRAGRILSSVLEDRPGEDGVKQIRMELELTAPWAVEDALRGHVDRFSIGWHSEGNTVCSICDEPMTVFWGWCFGSCDHEVGEAYDGKICQLEYTDAVGVEVSSVNVPAVVGTEVDDVRAQLSAARAGRAPVLGRQEILMKPTFLPALLAALALPATAGEDEALAGAEQLRTELEGARAALGDAQGQLAAVQGQLGELQKTANETRKATLLKRGLDEGRWVPNSKSAAHAQKLADKGNLDGLEAWLEDLPAGGAAPTQTGLRLQSAGGDATPEGGAITELTDRQKKFCEQTGTDPAAYLKTLNEQSSR